MKRRSPSFVGIVLWLAAGVFLCADPPERSASDEALRVEQARLERIPGGDLGNGYFRNPVLVGPGSDNTVLRVGKDFYMMAGGGWPDQLIWHSRDLVNWRPIVRALKKYDGGAWASELAWHDGKFYIYTTQVDPSRGSSTPLNVSQRSLLGVPVRSQGDRAWKNVVLWSNDPAGPWSDPIDIGVNGLFDPGHIVDEQGNRYLYFNKGMMIKLAPDGLSAMGELMQAYRGWEYPKDWAVECMCLEAPKLVFHDGFYYMASAQGGTAGPSTAHMAIMARSRSAAGPWENSPYNPMVRTWNRDEKWWRQGHGTLIDDAEGRWWFLYTGYENGYTHYGKQSLLLPVEWTADGWPRIVPGIAATDIIRKPAGANVGHGMPLSDDFSDSEIGIQWLYAPNVDPAALFRPGNGKLIMKAAGTIPGRAAVPPAEAVTLGVMPVHHSYEAEVEIEIPDSAEAGIWLGPGGRGGSAWATVGLRKGEALATWPGQANYLPWKGNRIFIRMRNMKFDVSAWYSADGKNWLPFANSTQVAEGRRLSLYAAGSGEVVFRNFKYRGLD